MITNLHEKVNVLLQTEGDHECEGIGKDKVCVRIVAMAELPTRFGNFHIIAFENNRDGKEHVAVTKGDVICQRRGAATKEIATQTDQGRRPFKMIDGWLGGIFAEAPAPCFNRDILGKWRVRHMLDAIAKSGSV